MKKFARLALFFTFSFVILFLAGAVFRFLGLRLQWMRLLPQEPETVLSLLVAAAHWALPLSLYGSLLFGLNFAARERMFSPGVVALLIVLSLGFSTGASLGLLRLGQVPPAHVEQKPLGGEGLILNQANTTLVLLKGPEDPRGPRVTAIPGRPLLYHAAPTGPNNTVLGLPPLSLGGKSPWFLESMAIDLQLSAAQMANRLATGLLPFLIYTGALIVFLVSLLFVFKLSAWPLANLFLGCLAFRGILALETFLNSPEMQDAFGAFLGNRLAASLTVSLIFCFIGLLVYLYSILVYLSKRRSYEED
ncbi:MAG: hypothetical protein LBH43_19130 [Treponema sp.]|nr:hypothetical protein [Treponema sp.]